MTSSVEREAGKGWADAGAKYARATASLPGGNTRTQLFTPPAPVYALSAAGSKVLLTDGQEVTDFLFNWTASVVGHAHPKVLEAARAAFERGAPYGVSSERELELAEAMRARFPTLELVRFTNSGTEATLHAIRVARAVTGRSSVAKAHGAYHGSHDLTDFDAASREGELGARALTPGVPQALAGSCVVFPYNDLEQALWTLEQHKAELATVIVEVFLNSAGAIPADREFLEGIADWCSRSGVLLTIDEVASWRTSYAGAHSDHGLEPDLICLGKGLGGGLPVGAFGGKHEVMHILDPRLEDRIAHAGTFNAHPAVMAAGLATLDILDRDAIARMNLLGERVRDGIREIGLRHDLPLTASCYGSIGMVHTSREAPRNAWDAAALPVEPRRRLYWDLLDEGFMIGPDGRFNVSSVTTVAEVDGLLSAVAKCVTA